MTRSARLQKGNWAYRREAPMLLLRVREMPFDELGKFYFGGRIPWKTMSYDYGATSK